MKMASRTLASDWVEATTSLGLRSVAPFVLRLPSGAKVIADVLIPDFGATNGMLIVHEFREVEGVLDELRSEGFGFSVLSAQRGEGPLIMEVYMDVLRDWGWAGPSDTQPGWMMTSEEE